MREIVCKRVSYINKIDQNLSELRLGEIRELHQRIRESDLLCLTAEGRSLSALKIGIRGIQKKTLAQGDTEFHWRNFYDAAPDLEKRYKKINMLANSGSGWTDTPKEAVQDTRNYIQEHGSESFTVCAVTSHRDSPVARKSDIILELKGRRKKEIETFDPFSEGMMGDQFELGSLILFLTLKGVINRKQRADQIPSEIKKEMRIVGPLIDRYYDSEQYQTLVKEISTRHRTIIGGKGPGQEVAMMTAIRIFHINQVSGGRIYLAGPLAPPPKPGDILLLVSWSGETGPVLKWCDKYQKAGCQVFSIVGDKSSTLAQKSTSFCIEAPEEKFYARAAFILSPVPGGKLEIFRKANIEIPENMLETFGHSVTQ